MYRPNRHARIDAGTIFFAVQSIPDGLVKTTFLSCQWADCSLLKVFTILLQCCPHFLFSKWFSFVSSHFLADLSGSWDTSNSIGSITSAPSRKAKSYCFWVSFSIILRMHCSSATFSVQTMCSRRQLFAHVSYQDVTLLPEVWYHPNGWRQIQTLEIVTSILQVSL